MRRFAILLIAGLVLVGCSKSHQPPSGRWIGHLDSPAVMVDAWLEISPAGDVRVSAPDILDPGEPSDEQRQAAHKRLANQVYDDWGGVVPRHYEFDGETFRKPGGVAPQMEWDSGSQQMKLVFYFGMQRSIRIAMSPVKNFNDDPWLAQ
jgi:hypothetical protein